MDIKVMAVEGCPNDGQTMRRVREVLVRMGMEAPIKLVEVAEHEAEAIGLLGSPTVLVDGEDIEPSESRPSRPSAGCRTYPGGGTVPPAEMIEAAIARSMSLAHAR